MDQNHLLFWLSANRNGSWGNFRSAIEEFSTEEESLSGRCEALPAHQRIRLTLQQLGHVEFDGLGCEGGWRTTPPVLALPSDDDKGNKGVICGARLPRLLTRLEDAIGASQIERLSSPGQPDVIRVSAIDAALIQMIVDKTVIRAQKFASTSILSCLPRVDDLKSWHAKVTVLPFGKHVTVKRFELGRGGCRWVDSSVDEVRRGHDGLFRFTRYEHRTNYMRIDGQTIQLQGQLGNYLLAAKRRRKLLRFNRLTQDLIVPDVCRPPLLVDRALILCSGFLPRHDPKNRVLLYQEVPESVAEKCAEVLCQDGL